MTSRKGAGQPLGALAQAQLRALGGPTEPGPDAEPPEAPEQKSTQQGGEKAESKAVTAAKKARNDAGRKPRINAAYEASFARCCMWMFYLPITRLQVLVLGRVFSFQCIKTADGTRGAYRMSMAKGAHELGIKDPEDLRACLQVLEDLGYVKRHSNGLRKPATYTVDVDKCMLDAEAAGYDIGGNGTGGDATVARTLRMQAPMKVKLAEHKERKRKEREDAQNAAEAEEQAYLEALVAGGTGEETGTPSIDQPEGDRDTSTPDDGGDHGEA